MIDNDISYPLTLRCPWVRAQRWELLESGLESLNSKEKRHLYHLHVVCLVTLRLGNRPTNDAELFPNIPSRWTLDRRSNH